MKTLRLKNPKNSYVNINSVRNKFKNMSSLISENVISSDSPNFSIIQDDVCITPQVDYDVISATTTSVIPTCVKHSFDFQLNILVEN